MRHATHRPPREYESFAARSFSNYDVIDTRIDVSAQKALIRLRGNPATASDAAGMLAAVKSGRLQGIYGDDLRASAQLAARLGTVRWELVPRGRVAALIREPNPAAPPTIIFRTQYRGDAARLDPALVAAWRSSLLGVTPIGGSGGMFYDEVYGYVTVVPQRTSAQAGAAGMMSLMDAAARTQRTAGAEPFASRLGAAPEAEMLDGDDRRVVRDTRALPNRFICKLLSAFEHPLIPNATLLVTGSGTLIGRRHVLTAAHLVFMNRLTGRRRDGTTFVSPTLPTTPSILFVLPGLNGQRQPLGSSIASRTRFPPQYVAPPPRDFFDVPPNDAEFDIGLITLAEPLGDVPRPALGNRPLGFWGSGTLGGGSHIIPLNSTLLQGQPVRTGGYPGDKCGDQPAVGSATREQLADCNGRSRATMQWQALGRVAQFSHPLAPGLLIHNADSEKGQSGGPVWTERLNLVAVHTGGSPDLTTGRATANRGVRITEPILALLRTWMSADGERPGF